MADYASSNTGRLRFRYQSQGQVHTTTFRTGRGTQDIAGAIASAVSFFNAMSVSRLTDWTALGVDYAGVDSEIFLPRSESIADLQPGTAVIPPSSNKPMFASFQGRTSGGSRASLYLYGVRFDLLTNDAVLQDYRVFVTESPSVLNAVGILNAATQFTGIDGLDALWKPYINIGLNAYYQRKQRG